MTPPILTPQDQAFLRRFFPSTCNAYRVPIPARVWQLLSTPGRWTRKWGSQDDKGQAIDERDHRAVAFSVRTAFFVVYRHCPGLGQRQFNLLQDVVGPDLYLYGRTARPEDILALLQAFDL